jgi:hypothetical protein
VGLGFLHTVQQRVLMLSTRCCHTPKKRSVLLVQVDNTSSLGIRQDQSRSWNTADISCLTSGLGWAGWKMAPSRRVLYRR